MVIGWLTKLVAVLAILLVGGYDAAALAIGHEAAVQDAQSAAQAAADAYQTDASLTGATQAAEQTLSGGESLLPGSLRVAPGGVVHLTLRRSVTTWLLTDLPGGRRWAAVDATATATPAPPGSSGLGAP